MITVIGLGYVGLANLLTFSSKFKVCGVDINQNRLKQLENKNSYLDEKELNKALIDNFNNLNFHQNITKEIVDKSKFFLICLPTNFNHKLNRFDTSIIENAVHDIYNLKKDINFVIKSTVPIGFTDTIQKKFKKANFIFSPEFLREGSSLSDNLNPSRVVLGGKNMMIINKFKAMINKTIKCKPKFIITDSESAEAIKLFSNTYLALRVAFFNEVDSFCLDGKISSLDVIKGVSLDPRIGDFYNNPSFGFGGYCLPKDTLQIKNEFKKSGISSKLINNISSSNDERSKLLFNDFFKKYKNSTVCVYRLSMKAGSDNFRESSILKIVKLLKKSGMKIVIYEPMISKSSFLGIPLLVNREDIKNHDVIISNRKDKFISKLKNVYSRDLFFNN